jgi:hypothetical protein
MVLGKIFGPKEEETVESCIMKRFMICTAQQLLVGLFNSRKITNLKWEDRLN